jgi:hypothetical protein
MSTACLRLMVAGCGLITSLLATGAAELPAPGHRPLSPRVHALVGAQVHISPGNLLGNATVIIRDGLIAAVGSEVAPPADARIWDAKGLVIYAGFIDPYLSLAGACGPDWRARQRH